MSGSALLFAFDRTELHELAEKSRDAYGAAKPFPHIVFDGFLPEPVLEEVLGEFPAPGDIEWWKFDSPHERGKLGTFDDSVIAPATRHLLAELNSSAFVIFLEELTGISGLVPDTHFFGGGLHQSLRGGHLDVHADFNRHPKTGLERRLNLLLYLNKDWPEEFGGELELWDAQRTRCEVKVAPVFNRCLIFSTSWYSFHGHPEPLACPEDRTRKSLALYYYTKDRPEGDDPGLSHPTLFEPLAQRGAPDSERRSGWNTLARRLLPPIAVDAAKALKRSSPRRPGKT